LPLFKQERVRIGARIANPHVEVAAIDVDTTAVMVGGTFQAHIEHDGLRAELAVGAKLVAQNLVSVCLTVGIVSVKVDVLIGREVGIRNDAQEPLLANGADVDVVFDRVAASRRDRGDIASLLDNNRPTIRQHGNVRRLAQPALEDLGVERGRCIRRKGDCRAGRRRGKGHSESYERPESERTWEGRQSPVSHGKPRWQRKRPRRTLKKQPEYTLERD
jgi:hypothetical protein